MRRPVVPVVPAAAVAAVVGLAAVLGACGDDGDAAAPEDRFCTAMSAFASSEASLTGLEQHYEAIETSAPDELAADVDAFIASARRVSAAFEAAGGPGPVDTEAVIRSLDATDRQFLQDLSDNARTGELSDSPAGRVIGHFVTAC